MGHCAQALAAQRSGDVDLTGSRRRGRTRTRALATRVWVRRSCVDHRIAMTGGAISTTGRRSIHPAVQSISRRNPARAAALRVAAPAGLDQGARPGQGSLMATLAHLAGGAQSWHDANSIIANFAPAQKYLLPQNAAPSIAAVGGSPVATLCRYVARLVARPSSTATGFLRSARPVGAFRLPGATASWVGSRDLTFESWCRLLK